MVWSRSLGIALLAGLTLTSAALPAAAQPAKPTTPATKPAPPPDGGVDGYDGIRRKPMSPEELGRLRMLEIRSGAYRDAKAGATAQTLVGPPLSDREKAQHALNRLAFGPRPGEVEQLLTDGGVTDQWQAWVKRQLNPDSIDDSELDSLVAARFPWTKMTVAQLYEKYPNGRPDTGPTYDIIKRELPESVVVRAALSRREFKEVMCEFWRNHFCVDNSPGDPKPRTWAAANYEETVVRANVFGKFKNMLLASAKHPAMLDYLDNRQSRANHWNENYAREVMELHTLGADRGYGNADVLELSKILTGWNYDKEYNFTFKADLHQPGKKQFLGGTYPPGYEAGEQALYLLATHKNTADFLATKLCRYLVNDTPPPALVANVSREFQRTEGDLPKVYAKILLSPEFTERANYRAKFKTPFEFAVSALRAVDAKVDDAKPTCQTLQKMGQEVYHCPDPTGYYDAAEAWMDSGVLTARWDFALRLAAGKVGGAKPAAAVLAKYKAMPPDDRFAMMIRDLIGDDVGDRTRRSLKDAGGANDVPRMVGILLGSPSFQQQ